MSCISLNEYGVLTSVSQGGQLPDACYLWLKKIVLEQQENEETEFLRLLSRNGVESLQVRNYVGLLQTPNGTCIEILPKINQSNDSRDESITLLLKMLQRVYELPALESTDASLEIKKSPLIEILISRFLKLVAILVHKGIRSDYIRIQEQRAFLKGRLRIAQQIRQPISKQHQFCIENYQFLPDRPENKLIRAALDQVLKWSQSSKNQKLARELQFSFIDIKASHQYKLDLSQWSKQRDMVYYQPLKSWVELILMTQTPWFMRSNWQGISLLFPMEKLFEAYIGRVLSKQLSFYNENTYTIKEQISSRYLTTYQDKSWFQLRPDFAIYENKQIKYILDAKWKLLDSDAGDSKRKYGLNQSDFYQLLAYGQNYLAGQGDMFLIYPAHKKFNEPLPVFSFNEELHLWIVPFDLYLDVLVLPDQFQYLFQEEYFSQSGAA